MEGQGSGGTWRWKERGSGGTGWWKERVAVGQGGGRTG